MSRTFRPEAKHNGDAWFALVYVGGATQPYWRGARFTRLGAALAARRKARELTRLEAKGKLL